jgi:hypothetical protein
MVVGITFLLSDKKHFHNANHTITVHRRMTYQIFLRTLWATQIREQLDSTTIVFIVFVFSFDMKLKFTGDGEAITKDLSVIQAYKIERGARF